jgi:integrase
VGVRDRAIILTLTGRRRNEVLGLKAGNLHLEGSAVYYTYRGKGGKQGKRELPQPAFRAIQAALAAFGKELANMRKAMKARGVPVALQQRQRPGHHQRHLLRQPAPVLPGGGPAARRSPHIPP